MAGPLSAGKIKIFWVKFKVVYWGKEMALKDFPGQLGQLDASKRALSLFDEFKAFAFHDPTPMQGVQPIGHGADRRRCHNRAGRRGGGRIVGKQQRKRARVTAAAALNDFLLHPPGQRFAIAFRERNAVKISADT